MVDTSSGRIRLSHFYIIRILLSSSSKFMVQLIISCPYDHLLITSFFKSAQHYDDDQIFGWGAVWYCNKILVEAIAHIGRWIR
mmetsp:Transcript_7481/g.8707  ORF Transcript_7481/g.8707 Transcript_7481/m.8707 type:complete len:83 (-) Transcript_7481:122-370(-)